jgi:HEPN domain-containing protein
MKDESDLWLDYAKENFESAKIPLKSGLLNPCLQNVQQSVEKSLKALLVKNSVKIKKTHSISQLKYLLQKANIEVELTEDECEFLDSIYLPSKYPLAGVLPDYDPNREICSDAIKIAERVLKLVSDHFK